MSSNVNPHCILETMPYLCHIHKFGYFFFYIRAYTVIVHVTKNTSDFYVIFVIIPGRRFPPNVGWQYVGWIKSINQELAYDLKKKNKKKKTYGQLIRHGTITSIVHVIQAGSVWFFLTYLIFNLSLKIHSRNYKTIGISITVYIDTLLHYFLF